MLSINGFSVLASKPAQRTHLSSIAILTGLQPGYTEHCCINNLWDSRNSAQHYTRKGWLVRHVDVPGTSNIANLPLVDRKNVILPPLHIKLGLIKQLVKALDKKSSIFKHLIQKFPSLSEAVMKEGIL